ELKRLLAKVAAENPPINPVVSAHIDQICQHHRQHQITDITIGLILAINEIQHAGFDSDATTDLIWRLMYAAAQMEKIRP
ncbi:MAG TPA: hypothetical protein VIG24_17425, partial [Acidimicrobiia bacterium]